MATSYSFSPLNPINFTEVLSSQKADTEYIHFGKDLHEYRVRFYESKDEFTQKFILTDNVTILIESTSTTHLPSLDYYTDYRPEGVTQTILPTTFVDIVGNIDQYGNQYRTYKFDIKTSDFTDNLDNDFEEGYYRFVISQQVGSVTYKFVSEYVNYRTFHPNTLLIKYKHSTNEFDTVFSLTPNFRFRIDGSINRLQSENEDSFFEEQDKTLVKLKSRPYRNYKAQFGVTNGVADWVVDKLNYIFSCDSVTINSIGFTKDENSKFEFNEIQGSPLVGISVNIREKDLSTPFSFRKGLIELFTVGSYPCFIPLVTLTDSTSDINVVNGYEVTNSSDLQDLVDDLNTQLASYGLLGIFSRVGDTAYYENDETENYVSMYDSGSLLYYYIDTNWDITSTSDATTLSFWGGVLGVVFANDPILYVSSVVGWNPISYGNFSSTGTKLIRIYFGSSCTKISLIGGSSNKCIEIVDSSVLPSQIDSFYCYNNNIDYINGENLFSLTEGIRVIEITNSNTSNINLLFFDNSITGLPYLTYIGLNNNIFDSTFVDSLINEVYDNKNWAILGSIVIDNQTPPAAPTPASATALAALQFAGWYIQTD